ncbi:MAG: pyrimidine-nucleoside phosphorylase [Oscillospiraceae bacterium]|nr:pyrimidine-nucleoside phosphorylase [Oscillospiraceae bacterium]
MRMIDLIEKKKRALPLREEEIRYFVEGFTAGGIPDYQAAALLMAICFTGMTDRETAWLTDAMAGSGDRVDLSAIPGIKVDKHSTGGVGDKTTLILAPLAAACGVPVAKMSGRGLGHTGGTVDKLESIPGFRTDLDRRAFLKIVETVGVCVAGQSGNLAPADKKLYALRDVTGTVDSIPLIASSIMSKKIAAGADAIVLDVKCGSGAFMKTPEDATRLARKMVDIGRACGRRMAAVITDMDRPLGHCIGNGLEVAEALEVLEGKGPEDLREVSLVLAAQMLSLAGKGDPALCRQLAQNTLDSGAALEKFRQMCQAQGGDVSVFARPKSLYEKAEVYELSAPMGGWVCRMDAEACGRASMLLGAGREKKDSVIDPAAGVVLCCKTGDAVERGQALARLYTNVPERLEQAKQALLESYVIGPQKPEPQPLVYDVILGL